MQTFIDEDEVLQARIAELYKDKTLTDDNRVQRRVDLINERGVQLALSQLSKSTEEEKKYHKVSAHECNENVLKESRFL